MVPVMKLSFLFHNKEKYKKNTFRGHKKMHNITMKLIPASRPQLCLYRRAWLLYQASSDITLQTRNYMPRPAKPVITIPVKGMYYPPAKY